MMKAPRDVSVRHQLRAAVDDDHLRVERLAEQLDMFNNPQGYGHWLGAMFALHHRHGAAVDAMSNAFGLAPLGDAILAALEDDLRALGATAPEGLTRGAGHDPSETLGIAYVLEGSSLGARVLRKRGEAAGLGTLAYLTLLSEEGPARWPRFRVHLDAATPDMGRAVAAARGVFDDLATLLSQEAALSRVG